jgi:hypothetical protein
MVTFERRVGRLVEIRVLPGGGGNVMTFARVIALANELGPDAKVFVVADVRKAPRAMSPEENQKLALAVKAQRERVIRAVTLVGEQPAQAINAERVVDLGPGRDIAQVTRSPAETIAALKPLLDPTEMARLKQFLDGK